MTYIPDCRTDPAYNEKFLNDKDKEFIRGYDYAVDCILNLFTNLEVFPDFEELLDDHKAIIKEGKTMIAQESVGQWAEMDRDELITSMINSMDEIEYWKIREEVEKNAESIPESEQA